MVENMLLDYDKVITNPDTMKKWKKIFEKQSIIFLFGVTGVGKTTNALAFAKKEYKVYSYLPIDDSFFERLEIETSGCTDKRINKLIIIDDVQKMVDRDAQIKLYDILSKAQDKNIRIRFFILSRADANPYIKRFVARGVMYVENKSSIEFTDNMYAKLLEKYKLVPNVENIDLLLYLSKRYPLAASMSVNRLASIAGSGYSTSEMKKKILPLLLKDLYDFFDIELIEKWDEDVVDFLIEVGVFPYFSAEFANYVRNREDSISIIEKIKSIGSFLSIFELSEIGYTNAKYKTFSFFRQYLKYKQDNLLGSSRKEEIYYRAGVYFEKNREFSMALECYNSAGEKDKIKELICNNMDKYGGIANLETVSRYFSEFTDEEIGESPQLICVASMTASIKMDIEKSEYYFEMLNSFINNHKTETEIYNIAVEKKIYLAFALPHRETRQIARVLLDSAQYCLAHGISMKNISATGGTPYLMNGGLDFSSWSRHDNVLYRLMKKPIELLLNKNSAGLADTGMGESMYQKNEISSAISYLVKGQSAAGVSGNLPMLFAAASNLSRVFVSEGDIDTAKGLIDEISNKVDMRGNEELLANIGAMKIYLSLLTGIDDSALNWYKEDSYDEYNDFFTTYRYVYLQKIRIYIGLKEYTKALALIEILDDYAKRYHRNMIYMEIMLLKAVVLSRQESARESDLWKEPFLLAVEKAASYSFVRLIADEGILILPLWKKALKENLFFSIKNKKYINETTKAIKDMALKYPNYLKNENSNAGKLSSTEYQILMYMKDGYSNSDIAKKIAMTMSGVKYHAANIYKKLGVKNRTEAIAVAKDWKVL